MYGEGTGKEGTGKGWGGQLRVHVMKVQGGGLIRVHVLKIQGGWSNKGTCNEGTGSGG